MANTVNNVQEESLEKAVWGYVGTAVMWLSLLLSGIAVERLGITSGILSGVLPGEVSTLRAKVTEQARDLENVKLDKANLQKQEGALRMKISDLEKQVAASAPAKTTP